MADLNQQIESLLKEVREIKENQKTMNDKLTKIQNFINDMEEELFLDENFDFEIVCPYCENEFVVDLSDDKDDVECPECKNTIELDWSGEFDDCDCDGHCHGCSDCNCDDEDDDM